MLEIVHNNDGDCYIALYGYITFDRYIANKVNLSEVEYQNVLNRRFNGYYKQNEIYFEKLEDAKKALEWVESAYLVNKLYGSS